MASSYAFCRSAGPFSQNRLRSRLPSRRLRSITLHFEDKEGSALELYLTGKGRLQDAHCKVSLSNKACEEYTRAQRDLDQMGHSQISTEIPFHVMPSKPRPFGRRVQTTSSKGLSRLSKVTYLVRKNFSWTLSIAGSLQNAASVSVQYLQCSSISLGNREFRCSLSSA